MTEGETPPTPVPPVERRPAHRESAQPSSGGEAPEVSIDRERISVPNSPMVDSEKVFRDLTLLIYPSVLGSILFNVFGLSQTLSAITLPKLELQILLIAIVVHYCVDYLYTLYIDRYTLLSFTLDLIVVSILFYSTTLINFDKATCDTRTVCLLFGITYVIFLTIDVMLGNLDKATMKVVFPEGLLAAAFLLTYFSGIQISILGISAFIAVAAATLFHIAPKPLLKT